MNSLEDVCSRMERSYAAADRPLYGQIASTLSCYDRIIITGALPRACYLEGMATYLRVHGVRLFDYPRLAEPLREH